MMSAFRELAETFAQQDADQGFGGRGWFPPAGNRSCDIVVGYFENEEKVIFKYKKFECPAVRLGLVYRTYDDPNTEEPRNWKGASICLPSQAVPEEAKWLVERETSRFKGFILTLVGEHTDMGEGWQAVKDMIDASNQSQTFLLVTMNNRAERDKEKKVTGYCTEFLQEILDTVTLADVPEEATE